MRIETRWRIGQWEPSPGDHTHQEGTRKRAVVISPHVNKNGYRESAVFDSPERANHDSLSSANSVIQSFARLSTYALRSDLRQRELPPRGPSFSGRGILPDLTSA